MSDSLIEAVKRLAEAERYLASVRGNQSCSVSAEANAQSLLDGLRHKLDAKALLAHMQAQQAVVDAARKHVAKHEADWKRHVSKEYDKDEADKYWPTNGIHEEGVAELSAALEKEKSNGKG